ncbi:MAG: ECF transporter S component, partial [bacterium]
AGLARVPFAAIPNVQPSSALIILAGAAFGWRVGALTGAVVPLVSNAFLGHGPWTPFQMLGWGLMGAAAAPVLGRVRRRLPLALFGALAGLAFGFIMNAWVWLASVRPAALHTFLPVLVRAIPFDLAHAAGNAVILWLVGPRLLTLMRRANVRRIVAPLDAGGVIASPRPPPVYRGGSADAPPSPPS